MDPLLGWLDPLLGIAAYDSERLLLLLPLPLLLLLLPLLLLLLLEGLSREEVGNVLYAYASRLCSESLENEGCPLESSERPAKRYLAMRHMRSSRYIRTTHKHKKKK